MKYQEACRIFELEVNHDCNESELKRKYKRLSLRYHPDKNPSPDACLEFQQLQDAYDILLGYQEEEYDIESEVSTDADMNAEIGRAHV